MSFNAKSNVIPGNEDAIINSSILSLIFAILMTILVSVTELWPEKFHCYIEPSMQEEILISYVCSKWGINSNLTKLDKLNAILEKLTKALNAKKEVDRRLEELLLND